MLYKNVPNIGVLIILVMNEDNLFGDPYAYLGSNNGVTDAVPNEEQTPDATESITSPSDEDNLFSDPYVWLNKKSKR